MLDAHLQEAPRVGAQRRFPELLRVHFAEALEALDLDRFHFHAIVARAVEDRFTLLFVERVLLLRGALAKRWNVDLVERRARDIDMAALDELRKVAIKER